MPTELDNIISAIKTLAESVPGIGLVYSQIPIARSEKEVKANLMKDDKVNVMGFVSRLRKVEKAEGWSLEDVGREFVFIHQYGYSFEDNSQADLNNFTEAFCNAFNKSENLGIPGLEHTKMDMEDSQPAMYGNILVHVTSFRMTVYKNQNNV